MSKNKKSKTQNYTPDKEIDPIAQNSKYKSNGKAEADNNIFWENGSNPLSSKGN